MEIENVNINEIDIDEVVELEVDVEQIGPRGLSAYEVYLQHGGTLSETDWLLSLNGEKGETGSSGVYIGKQEPEDPTVNIWIDISDDMTALYAEKEVF